MVMPCSASKMKCVQFKHDISGENTANERTQVHDIFDRNVIYTPLFYFFETLNGE